MALYTPKDFADLLGCTLANISTYKSRGKVRINVDKNLYDDQDPVNAAFIVKRQAIIRQTVQDAGADIHVPASPALLEEVNSANAANKNRKKAPFGAGADELVELEIEVKRNYAKKLEADTKHRNIQIEKLRGILIPTELVKMTFLRHNQSLLTAFSQALDNHLVEIAALANLSNKQVADSRSELTKTLNEAIKNATTASVKDIKNIVSEYSITRGKGEKKS